MTDAPSRALRLFGTEEPVAPPRQLTAGRLTAEFEAGNLRYIRFDGMEMICAVSFIVRDKNWGTYNPTISNLLISEDPEGFYVSYDAVARDEIQEFRYSAVISGKPDGTLRFEGRGEAVTDFQTNRTGFVVLHPVAGVAGHPARIEEVDGRITDTEFPDIIDPVQPMMNLRAITHSFAPGASVTCRMEGDTYEMEDQRNWTDASYKTYVRPLALPWPYKLAAGETLDQAVTLTVSGEPRRMAAAGGAVTYVSARRRGRCRHSASGSTRTRRRRRSRAPQSSAGPSRPISSAITIRAAGMIARASSKRCPSQKRSGPRPGSRRSSPRWMASPRRWRRSAKSCARSARPSRSCSSHRHRT
jgi:hypothetical protein